MGNPDKEMPIDLEDFHQETSWIVGGWLGYPYTARRSIPIGEVQRNPVRQVVRSGYDPGIQ